MKNKHYLIIGGTRGIGKSIVERLSKRNHTLSVIGRHIPRLTQKRISYWRQDLSDKKSLSKTLANIVKKNGKISHCIFCQRYRGDGEEWIGEFSVSLTATKQIIEFIKDHFDDTPERSIVIINSVAHFLVGLEQPLSYHVGKAGLLQLARFYTVILGPKGIRVNCVSPCTILKDESKHIYLQNTKLYNLYKQIIPLGRMGTAKEIATIVEFLCSSASSFITGANIIADGGLSLQSPEYIARMVTSQGYAKK